MSGDGTIILNDRTTDPDTPATGKVKIFHKGTSVYARLDNGTVVDLGSQGTTDHGALGGLGDDDHTQYSLADGSRAFTGVVSGVTPTADAHLARKDYVDNLIGGGGRALTWEYDTTTADADPGTGKFRLNNTPGSATELYVADNSDGGADVSTLLQILVTGSKLIVSEVHDKTQYAAYTLGTLTDAAGYTKFPLTLITNTGLTNGVECEFTFAPITLGDHASTHEDGGVDEISIAALSGEAADAQKTQVLKNGSSVGTRKAINLIEGSNVTLTVADDVGNDRINVTAAATDTNNTTGGVDEAMSWEYDTTTITDADPGTAKFKLNNASQSAATFIYIDDLSYQNVQLSDYISLLVADGGHIILQDHEDGSNWVQYDVSGAPVDAAGYWKIPVSHVANGGGGITATAQIGFRFIPPATPSGLEFETVHIDLSNGLPITGNDFPAIDNAALVRSVGANEHITVPSFADTTEEGKLARESVPAPTGADRWKFEVHCHPETTPGAGKKVQFRFYAIKFRDGVAIGAYTAATDSAAFTMSTTADANNIFTFTLLYSDFSVTADDEGKVKFVISRKASITDNLVDPLYITDVYVTPQNGA